MTETFLYFMEKRQDFLCSASLHSAHALRNHKSGKETLTRKSAFAQKIKLLHSGYYISHTAFIPDSSKLVLALNCSSGWAGYISFPNKFVSGLAYDVGGYPDTRPSVSI